MNNTEQHSPAMVAGTPGRRVADLMSSPVVSTTSDVVLAQAGRTMMAAGVGSVVVVDDGRAPIAILTERALVRAAESSADPDRATVGAWMTAAPEVVQPGGS